MERKNDALVRKHAEQKRFGGSLSIFWRLALGWLAILVLMALVNLYMLIHLRQLTSLGVELVSEHYPAIETAKRLFGSLIDQHESERKYLAVHDQAFRTEFDAEAREFNQTLLALLSQEPSSDSRRFLEEAGRMHARYRTLFRGELDHHAGLGPDPASDYVAERDALIAAIANSLQRYIRQHEDKVGSLIAEGRAHAHKAETVTQRLEILAVVLGLALAGAVSYSILRPLRRLRDHIRAIGHGAFGAPVRVAAPSDLRDLVETVNWMRLKLQEIEEMKREFLANVSHELRTPLASIHEGTHLLLDEIPGSLTAEQREALHIMADSSRQLIQLITNLLDFSKMEAGMMEYRIAPTDLKRVVEVSVNKVRLLADRRRIKLLTQSPPGRIWVQADGSRIEQVLDNLFSNALKFSPTDATVELRIEPDFEAGVTQITVSDEGPGIAPQDLPHIFDRFYQGRQQPGKPAGSGLGLSIARRAVEAHGGQVRVENRPGRGAMIRLTLPPALLESTPCPTP